MPTIQHVGRRLSARFIKSQLHGAGPFELRLPGCVITGDLRIEKKAFTHVDLTGCHCQGTITFADCNLPSHGMPTRARFKMRGARVDGGLRIRRGYKSAEPGLSTWADIDLTDSQVLSSIEIDGVECNRLALVQVRSKGSLKLRRRDKQNSNDQVLHSIINNDLDAHGLEVEGDVLLRGVTVKERAIFSNAKIGGVFSAQVWKPHSRDADPTPEVSMLESPSPPLENSVELMPTTLRGGLWLTRAKVSGGVLLQGVRIQDQFDARFAQFGGLDLSSERIEACSSDFTFTLSEILRMRMAIYRGVYERDFGIPSSIPEWIQLSDSVLLSGITSEETKDAVSRIRFQNYIVSYVGSDCHGNQSFTLNRLGNGYAFQWRGMSEFAYGLVPNMNATDLDSRTAADQNGNALRKELRFPEETSHLGDLFDSEAAAKPNHFGIKWDGQHKESSFAAYVGFQATKLWHSIPAKVGITLVKGEVQLDSVNIAGDIILSGARLESGIRIPGGTIAGKFEASSKPLIGEDTHQPVEAERKYVPTRIGVMRMQSPKFAVSIHAENLTVGKSFQVAGVHLQSGINLMGAKIGGNVFLSGDECNRTIIGASTGPSHRIYSLRLSAAEIGGNVLFHGSFLSSGVSVENSKIDGDISGISTWVQATLGTAERRTYVGQGFWDKHERASLHLNGARIKGDADFRGAFLEGGVLCESSEIEGFLGLGSIDRAGSRMTGGEDDFQPRKGTEDERYVSCFIGPAQDTLIGAFSVILTNSRIEGSVDLRGAIIRCGIYAGHASINGDLLLQRFLPRTARQASTFTCVGPGLGAGWQLSLRGTNASEAALFTPHAKIGGHIYLQGAVLASGWSGSGTEVKGSVQATPFDSGSILETRTIICPGRRRDREFCVRLPQSTVGADFELDYVSFRAKGLSRYSDTDDGVAGLPPLVVMEGGRIAGAFSIRYMSSANPLAFSGNGSFTLERHWPTEALELDKGSCRFGETRCLDDKPRTETLWRAVLMLLSSALIGLLVTTGVLVLLFNGRDWLNMHDQREQLVVIGMLGLLVVLLGLLTWLQGRNFGTRAAFEVEGIVANKFRCDIGPRENQKNSNAKPNMKEAAGRHGISFGHYLVMSASRPSGHGGFLSTDCLAGAACGTFLLFSLWASMSSIDVFNFGSPAKDGQFSVFLWLSVWFTVVLGAGLLVRFARSQGHLDSLFHMLVQLMKVVLGKPEYRDGASTGKFLFLSLCDHNEATYNQFEAHARVSGDHALADRIALHWHGRDIRRNLRRLSSLGQVPSYVLMAHGVRGARVLLILASLFFVNLALMLSETRVDGGWCGRLSRYVASGGVEMLEREKVVTFYPNGASSIQKVSLDKSRGKRLDPYIALAALPLVPIGSVKSVDGVEPQISNNYASLRLIEPFTGGVFVLETRMGVESFQSMIRSIGVFLIIIVGQSFFKQSPRLSKMRGDKG